MIGIMYKEEVMDVGPDTAISWELNNLVFTDSDSSKLPGSFSFPFSLPATMRNRRLLNYPDRIDNAEPFVIEGDVTVQFNGIVLFPGTMKVMEASDVEIRVYIFANPLSTIKTIGLNEVDLGGDRVYADEEELLLEALDTTTDPYSYDFVYFPMYNVEFLTNENNPEKNRWMNWYDADGPEFLPDDDAPGFMPFVRVEYLLQQIFADEAYAFVNDWQITNELKGLVLYNHYSIYTDGALGLTINLRNHVPETKCHDFVRKLCALFNLGLFYNAWDKTLRLIPVRDLINTAARYDWTSKLLKGVSIKYESANVPVRFFYEDMDSDNIQELFRTRFPKPDPADVIDTVATLPFFDATGVAGIYYVTSEAQYWLRIIGVGGTRNLYWTDLMPAPVETGTPDFSSDIQPLYDAHIPFVYPDQDAGTWMLKTPITAQPGTITYNYTPPGTTDIERIEQKNKNPLRLTIYRGINTQTPYTGYGSRNIPFACSTPYNAGGAANGTVSLRWEGEYGLYEQWWKGWHTMLRQGKNVTALLHLSITDLLSFQFEHKVRIQNQDYFVKKLRISLTPRGLAPVEAELVSVI